jgi:hypothetical protein
MCTSRARNKFLNDPGHDTIAAYVTQCFMAFEGKRKGGFNVTFPAAK